MAAVNWTHLGPLALTMGSFSQFPNSGRPHYLPAPQPGPRDRPLTTLHLQLTSPGTPVPSLSPLAPDSVPAPPLASLVPRTTALVSSLPSLPLANQGLPPCLWSPVALVSPGQTLSCSVWNLSSLPTWCLPTSRPALSHAHAPEALTCSPERPKLSPAFVHSLLLPPHLDAICLHPSWPYQPLLLLQGSAEPGCLQRPLRAPLVPSLPP